jgi:hypothetical protein
MRVALPTSMLLLGFLFLHSPAHVKAQFSDPCQVTCAAVLGATGFVAATGASVAVGRLSGGMSTVDQGLWVWGSSFLVFAGGGVALAGDGERQERAVYAAGIGTAAGALAGLALGAVRTSADGPQRLAGVLVGATVGALLGGAYGALSHKADASQSTVPLFTLQLPF